MDIVVDAFGGDNAPREIVGGSITAVNLNEDINITLVGKESAIRNELEYFGYKGNKISIVNADEVITGEDVPTSAIRTKTNSSLVVALELFKTDSKYDAFVSAGSTGAVLTGALLKIGRIKGVSRPALAPLMPNAQGTQTLLIDCGANVDSKPEFLVDFAVMGSIYMSNVLGVNKPRVALLNVGTEDHKGNQLTHEVFELLKSREDINFVGNMEARDALSGGVDVIVSDGFAGNVLLKSIEGTALFIINELKQGVKSAGIKTKLGAVMMKKVFKNLKNKMDYKNVGGSVFLGVQKVVVKAHGSADARCFYSAILQAKKMVESGVVDTIKSSLGE